ncbi:bifunctional 4-hydroxy-2-oxoglutarate aldolase/2-dehydro-3-deoxy-phosphogluconate aldolase [Pseudarthrobacter psychrotolerans]|uniref:Bifunctional 4-hydroxy-2-oxoglutarate aldolase/2-dehydro-3-deoxy-phosphogluconate aldolase n=1 Tax=Pseudarthrobacter psychrotolerans TaxID=2697569 RepID=A0A6P1NJB6_9MICC|nr:bifunctional 4-hydroxy-2-oxoglutarate aldolase/2-dehydro-3-deoxy-phosphogluconate aldolase [Pseudarthrobacter psychrotolerans]QHK18564.1 bifunctional 4-hydroxy-2-oxoglutarate aldolase/2-dehydro-3-deoxy-phosphogluconate aldolase [Pseudarthrobacter psychrotolerans]
MPERIPLPDPIHQDRIVAVLRAPAEKHLLAVALELHRLGIRCLEITFTSPGALGVIEELRKRLGDEACIGAGTVMTAAHVRDAANAGAMYLLAPVTDPAVLSIAQEHGMPFVTGAATPTEVMTGWNLGASAVKVFPAHTLGGASFIKSLLDPLPQVSLLPTGGVGADEVAGYLAAGALAVGAGSPLTGDALTGGSLEGLKDRVRAFLDAAQANGGPLR